MAKKQPPAFAMHSRKCHPLTTVRKGQPSQTSSNGIDQENIKHGLCATAAYSTKYTKKVAMHHTTKIAKKTEEVVNAMDSNDIKMTSDNDVIDIKMVDDTAMMLSLQSADHNNDNEWMDASNKDINGIIQKLDYKYK
eukprot:11957579-Ditylum_brightwellii.AAC.1